MEKNIEHIRHSLAHLLAAAVLELYPDTKLTLGPAIDNGFYYDFDFTEPLTEKDLPKIEKKMKSILKHWTKFTHKEVSEGEAKETFANNPYKLELIEEISHKGEKITLYTCGNFTDLCRGGHAENPAKEIDSDAFKLDRIAGAYWRGDEKNKMLTRIYGLAFPTKEELDAYIAQVEEAKKRDHKKLGKELKLFSLIDEIGPGLPLFYPKGAILRRLVENYIIEMQEKNGYLPIWIPHITKGELYKISGHLDKYDAMYPPMELKDEAKYYLKPMNCPHFMMLYKTTPHSYRDLPVRWTCTTTNYRYEKSGELAGLTRVRALTQDDCHVFTRPDQIEQEINLMLDMVDEVYKTFKMDNFWVRISVHDPKKPNDYIGDKNVWATAETALEKLIKNRGWEHQIGVGEAAFYGPKLDFMAKDAIGREWQLSTIQLDMNLPQRFKLEYTDQNGESAQPVVIHRALLGSTERFLGVMIEHFAGAFPLWLSPVQVAIIPVSEKFMGYANEIYKKMKALNIRVELNEANESLGKRIREAETMKTPYICVIGEKEVAENTVSVRARGGKDEGALKVDEFTTRLKNEIDTKKA